MGLREQAAADLKSIVEDDATGFAWTIILTSPLKVSHTLKGLSTDIGQTYDQETGVPIAGRRASVTLSLATLTLLNLAPKNVTKEDSKPWTVRFTDSGGSPHTYKIVETMPDRTLGALVCLLEFYK